MDIRCKKKKLLLYDSANNAEVDDGIDNNLLGYFHEVTIFVIVPILALFRHFLALAIHLRLAPELRAKVELEAHTVLRDGSACAYANVRTETAHFDSAINVAVVIGFEKVIVIKPNAYLLISGLRVLLYVVVVSRYALEDTGFSVLELDDFACAKVGSQGDYN